MYGQTPEPTRPPIAGFYGQDCTPASGDFPDKCPRGQTGKLLRSIEGKIECIHNHDCCLCGRIQCAPNCAGVVCNGDSSCFGVKDINIVGERVMGADINCNGDVSCQETRMVGTNIGRIQCTGDWSCALGVFELVCVDHANEGCTLECLGDDSCKGHPTDPTRRASFKIVNSMGMACAHDSCRDADFSLINNKGGGISCGAEAACVGATITVDNIEDISCLGEFGCYAANILVTNPQNGFSVSCGGFQACGRMNLEIIVTDPTITWFKGVECNSVAACKDISITINNYHGKELKIDSLACAQRESCRHAVFDLSPNIVIGDCQCGGGLTMACDNIMGVSQCASGLSKFECVGTACKGLVETISNPAQDLEILCASPGACSGMKLTILVDGSRSDLTRFKGVTCGSPYACSGMEINVINSGAKALDAGLVECGSSSSCKNVQLNTYNADFGEIKCGDTTSCRGCQYNKDGRCGQCAERNAQCLRA